jgi:hypothetical protein
MKEKKSDTELSSLSMADKYLEKASTDNKKLVKTLAERP